MTERDTEPDRHKHTDDHPAELTPTEARQGSNRQMNLRVLLFGLLLLALAWLVTGTYFYTESTSNPPTDPAVTRQ
jgi:hypothetical protein